MWNFLDLNSLAVGSIPGECSMALEDTDPRTACRTLLRVPVDTRFPYCKYGCHLRRVGFCATPKGPLSDKLEHVMVSVLQL